ncbi:peptidoglycan DD-metalloendopeptidase family protein [Bacillus sp. ISL-47]|uniref:M23 family metallopeptidase n=1 Tax=Bacillus sp. ISL-47 TaxID=2819130 RepID=UPI001BE88FE1|nr:M23 family metallopeptidase [Bacillus sp. ISL-47]MBT2686937.1 peptidoglycan DD-metalloendopeptidase family protein [Bacillus sp. ISL-47]MBT2707763.1 peptidoglycan DD-metalloendopeptidase family protein [Pseudomonas sp. ISL-84]
MRDYIRRFFIAGIMALCVGLLFLGGKHSKAAELNVEDLTKDWMWPADGVITDTFGTRHGQHKGIDIAAESGSPVYAVDSGIVSKSYYSQTYGHVIFIKHSNQTETVYAHMNERLAGKGQQVNQGEKIGTMGNTGDSSGVHLHFEIHKREWTVDKENAVDPFVAYGKEEIGQPVYAALNEESAQEVSAQLSQLGPGQTRILEHPTENAEILAPEPGQGEESVHIVQQGETLWEIARMYNLSVKAIANLNKIEQNKIVSGQKLRIRAENYERYAVKKGDTLTAIANHYQTSAELIKEINKLDTDIIHVGQLLIIRQNE